MVYVHPDGGLCVADGLFGHVGIFVVGFIVVCVHPDGGVSATDGLFGHMDTPAVSSEEPPWRESRSEVNSMFCRGVNREAKAISIQFML